MKSLLQKYSLLAVLTLALPFALIGCNKAADDTTAPASNPPPADTNAMSAPADTNAMAAPAATTDTNAAAAPASTNTPSKAP